MRIVFMGTPQAAVPSLQRLISDGHEVAAVWTQPDRPAGRGNKLKPSPVKVFAEANGIRVYQPARIKNDESLEAFRAENADLAVVVAYGRILPESYLNAFSRGCINLHFSLLPKYRGAAPVNWAIVNGEDKTGVATMQMDAGLDTGDILLMKEVGIGGEETSVQLMERLSSIGAEALSETLERLNEIIPQKQDDKYATYAPVMKKEDGLINWEMSAKEIANRVRGFQPFPGSYTRFREKKLTIWKCRPSEAEARGDEAGKVIFAKGKLLEVACGKNTKLLIDELQAEGKNRVTTQDFLNGSKISPGESFGA